MSLRSDVITVVDRLPSEYDQIRTAIVSLIFDLEDQLRKRTVEIERLESAVLTLNRELYAMRDGRSLKADQQLLRENTALRQRIDGLHIELNGIKAKLRGASARARASA